MISTATQLLVSCKTLQQKTFNLKIVMNVDIYLDKNHLNQLASPRGKECRFGTNWFVALRI